MMTSLTKADPVAEKRRDLSSIKRADGFSLIELLIVVTVMGIMMTFAIFALTANKTLYKSDDEAIRIVNVLREASQLALTQRQAMRVEIDGTNKTIKIVDENFNGTTDDRIVRTVYLEKYADMRLDTAPSGVTKPNPPNYTDASFTGTPKVWKIWFKRDGQATDSAGTPLSATLYIWPPNPANTNQASNKKLARAITIFGTSGVIRFWKHNGTDYVAS